MFLVSCLQFLIKEAKEKSLVRFNHDYIGAMLTLAQGNITHAVKKCNMDRQAVQQVLKRYGIAPEHFRSQ